MEAKDQLELLNRGDALDMGSIDLMNDDHLAYLSIYRNAADTVSKRQAMMARRNALKEQMRAKKQQPMIQP